MELGARPWLAAALLAVASADAQPQPAAPCGTAELAGRFFASDLDGSSWTLLLEPGCGYSSLRLTGDPDNDIQQPTRGVARLAQVDRREVVILQSGAGEFDDVMSVVRQGSRVYLVPTNQHLRFCVEWARGLEPRKGPVGRYLLRGGGDPGPAPKQLPSLCQPSEAGPALR